jgi:hypothetical protein
MFDKRITLFTLLGFAVRVDLSWLLIAALVTWSLAAGVFPREYQNTLLGHGCRRHGGALRLDYCT